MTVRDVGASAAPWGGKGRLLQALPAEWRALRARLDEGKRTADPEDPAVLSAYADADLALAAGVGLAVEHPTVLWFPARAAALVLAAAEGG